MEQILESDGWILPMGVSLIHWVVELVTKARGEKETKECHVRRRGGVK